jgi:hypothetical protein
MSPNPSLQNYIVTIRRAQYKLFHEVRSQNNLTEIISFGKMAVAVSSETPITTHNAIQCHNPEVRNLNIPYSEI